MKRFAPILMLLASFVMVVTPQPTRAYDQYVYSATYYPTRFGYTNYYWVGYHYYQRYYVEGYYSYGRYYPAYTYYSYVGTYTPPRTLDVEATIADMAAIKVQQIRLGAAVQTIANAEKAFWPDGVPKVAIAGGVYGAYQHSYFASQQYPGASIQTFNSLAVPAVNYDVDSQAVTRTIDNAATSLFSILDRQRGDQLALALAQLDIEKQRTETARQQAIIAAINNKPSSAVQSGTVKVVPAIPGVPPAPQQPAPQAPPQAQPPEKGPPPTKDDAFSKLPFGAKYQLFRASLEARCFKCHGPQSDGVAKDGRLDLDHLEKLTEADWLDKESGLVARVAHRSTDKKKWMPRDNEQVPVNEAPQWDFAINYYLEHLKDRDYSEVEAARRGGKNSEVPIDRPPPKK